ARKAGESAPASEQSTAASQFLTETRTHKNFSNHRRSFEQIADNVRAADGHIGKRLFPAVVNIEQLPVIDTKLMKDRGVQIKDAALILPRLVADFISRAVHVTGFDPTAGKPHGEGPAIMIAPFSILRNR